MRISFLTYLVFFILFSFHKTLIGQYDIDRSCMINASGSCIANPISTAVPFLRIPTNARFGGIGNTGIAISPDPNTIDFNLSNISFAKNNFGVSVNYTPKLSNAELTDAYQTNISAFQKINKNETIAINYKYIKLGQFELNNINTRNNIDINEFYFGVGYARKLGLQLSIGMFFKYIESNILPPTIRNDLDFFSGKSAAADISITYNSKSKSNNNNISIGISITNIGSKIHYRNRSDPKAFIPTNLGLGTSYTIQLNNKNNIVFAFDINKLLVPTNQALHLVEKFGTQGERRYPNPNYDVSGGINGGPDGIDDHMQGSLISGIIRSFSDAPGGFSEELKEIYFSSGVEYSYRKKYTARMGYFYENEMKGNRKFLTFGIGILYQNFTIDFSYLTSMINNGTAGGGSDLNNSLMLGLSYRSKK